ncbi:spore cortex biosynthesis protein YabQ [Peribacillus sp. SCS-26]|uniref:spore cortex biosynthesis protein YabQ n=1 Tax=Paraperibacillus marinus TaxID=3115295 RepID=UPI003905EADE
MTLTTQFYTLLSIIGMGCYFGAALDTYNLFLKRSKRKSWVVFINDFLFWVAQGLIIFYVLFLVNEGDLRFYLFLALLCGFAAYQALFKKSYLRVLRAVVSIVRKLFQFLVNLVLLIVFKPISWILLTAAAILLTLAKGLFSLAKFLLKPLLSIIKGLLIPFFWIARKLGGFMPKAVKSRILEFLRKGRRIFRAIGRSVLDRVKRTKK